MDKALTRKEWRHHFGPAQILRHRYHPDLALHLAGKRIKLRHLHHARGAPCRPQIEQHGPFDDPQIKLCSGCIAHHQFETRFNEQSKRLEVFANNELLDVNVVISHSHQHVGVALSLGSRTVLGLDIEKIDEKRPFQKLAAHFYPKQEACAIGDNVDTFFRVWTLKEAFAKAAKQSISTLLSHPILPLLENIQAQVLCEQWQQFDVSLITATEQVQFIDLAPTIAGESL